MRTSAALGTVAALAVASCLFWAGAIPTVHAQGPPGQPPAEQKPAALPPQVFGSDVAMVLNFIKPDKTADFEEVIAKLKEALQKSDRPERKQQAVGWRVFKAAEPGPAGAAIYLFVIDHPLKGANYSVAALVAEAFPAQARVLQQEFADTLAQGQTFLNLTVTSILRR